MIDKVYGGYQITCDNCEDGIEVSTYQEAQEYMRENDWKRKMDKESGEWLHYCRDCRGDK